MRLLWLDIVDDCKYSRFVELVQIWILMPSMPPEGLWEHLLSCLFVKLSMLSKMFQYRVRSLPFEWTIGMYWSARISDHFLWLMGILPLVFVSIFIWDIMWDVHHCEDVVNVGVTLLWSGACCYRHFEFLWSNTNIPTDVRWLLWAARA